MYLHHLPRPAAPPTCPAHLPRPHSPELSLYRLLGIICPYRWIHAARGGSYSRTAALLQRRCRPALGFPELQGEEPADLRVFTMKQKTRRRCGVREAAWGL
ncbi:hypothetical protein EYF80_065697 [Liparis tanakae]|uniref:Uncharacterized protein n=1 Tax=Liparis tanakae TaxID=230148 RepID=A0A4Z2E5Z4_9TELE|nr:hypothetical protein EYF80_065697 [Liparis tanakae]